ncbi:toxic anion resistance protein [Cellulosilyticum ruminicola]|uniref:toxic anion resistance protein n=1 Tax=Cellulosilyticum ruminicola TaxID=425254 RepID=UPI0009F86DD4|nr:toxic anion resistance protein [Cellulosilyticum ruminicola]
MAISLENSIKNGLDVQQLEQIAQNPTPTTLSVSAPIAQPELVPVKQEDVAAYTASYKEKLRQLPEVEALTSEIHIDNMDTILAFGQNATQGISKISDSLLSTMKQVKAEEAGEMIGQLTKVMDRFDIKELEDIKEPKGLQKLFNRAKNSVDAMFQKYENMGTEVDKIYVILKKYDMDIQNSNKALKSMYDANITYYEQLEKYIVAGEMGLEEIDQKLIPEFQAKADAGDRLALTTVQSLQTTREMLAQRVYDLQIAENIALQTIPMIQGIQYSNFNLTRKINSAFIITLPIFKQCLTQAVLLKRQELQAKSLKALDDKTNELLMRNAQNMATQTANIARLAGTSSVSMDTLENTWHTILQGIEQTKEIEKDNRIQREANTAKLENMKYELLKAKR